MAAATTGSSSWYAHPGSMNALAINMTRRRCLPRRSKTRRSTSRASRSSTFSCSTCRFHVPQLPSDLLTRPACTDTFTVRAFLLVWDVLVPDRTLPRSGRRRCVFPNVARQQTEGGQMEILRSGRSCPAVPGSPCVTLTRSMFADGHFRRHDGLHDRRGHLLCIQGGQVVLRFAHHGADRHLPRLDL